MKYVIPRNKLVPDPSFEDILKAGPRFIDKEGNPVGDQATLYRGNDMSFPNSAMLIEGKLFHYKEGMIYLPEFASYSDMYFDFSKRAAKAGVTSLLANGVESIIGELPSYLASLVHTGIEHAIFPEKEQADLQLKRVVEDLVKKGAVYLPCVQLVEIEYQTIPAGFFRKMEHRFLFTYERLNGERVTYGIRIYSSNPQDLFVTALLKARMEAEFGYLIPAVKNKLSDAEQISAALIEKYQALYGDKLPEHFAEMIAEYQNLCDAELEQKGITQQRLHAAVLEQIASLVSSYRQIPQFKEAVEFLEESAKNNPAPVP